ncbi:ribonuclease III [Hellea balneolensis]|uniref:ribonuclease III n=1 Tax=Hellea balneolensis TaxID=287478 RepID=UPI0004169BE3|nr:ribonuclease III [Hellea balneolensis]
MKPEYRRLSVLENRMGYVFKDKELALRALTHSSFGDGRRKTPDYERLEFLGDRVLGLMTAEKLFFLSTEKEGTLARRLNALVRKETCARISQRIGIGEALLLSPSEERQGGRDKNSILGDACEAIIGAIYIDGGFSAAQSFYDVHWKEDIEAVTHKSMKDPKTALQEKASVANKCLPIYTTLNRTGPDHKPLFVIQVEVEGVGRATGTGKSKKDAERFAAIHLLEEWPS